MKGFPFRRRIEQQFAALVTLFRPTDFFQTESLISSFSTLVLHSDEKTEEETENTPRPVRPIQSLHTHATHTQTRKGEQVTLCYRMTALPAYTAQNYDIIHME